MVIAWQAGFWKGEMAVWGKDENYILNDGPGLKTAYDAEEIRSGQQHH